MNSREIERLCKRFIAMTMISILIVMAIFGTVINVAQIVTTRHQVRATLDAILAQSEKGIDYDDSKLDERKDEQESRLSNEDLELLQRALNLLRTDILHNAQYFTVVFPSGTENTEDAQIHMFRMTDIEKKDALVLARSVTGRKQTFGRWGMYYYEYEKTEDGTFVACMNFENGLYTLTRLSSLTLFVILLGIAITYLLVRKFSRRAVGPMIENSRRQQSFITNASHELKTPLAVIRSNTELMEMLDGPSEWTASTLKQVDRLDSLIQNLVMIARSQEQENSREAAEIDVSALVKDTAEPFAAVAANDQKAFSMDLEPDVRIVANESSIQTLTGVLVDNAIKYCDENGSVMVRTSSDKKGRTAVIQVSNSYAEGRTVDYSRFFERFYREDESHHTESGEKKGFGIGLSIAQNICSLYHGDIAAGWKDGQITFTCRLSSLRHVEKSR